MPKVNQKAFTLIELLIVIAIIAILTAMVAVSYTTIQRQTRDTQRRADLAQVASALQRFYSNNNFFPGDVAGNFTYNNSNCSATAPDETTSWGTSEFGCNNIVYLRQLPNDPRSGNYCYDAQAVSGAPNQRFVLYANLEGTGNTSTACNGVTYNFRMTNNN